MKSDVQKEDNNKKVVTCIQWRCSLAEALGKSQQAGHIKGKETLSLVKTPGRNASKHW